MIPPPASPWPTVAELLGDLAGKVHTVSELTEEALACAREHKGLNAFAALHVQAARARARELDEHLSSKGALAGPLHGIPFAIKDNLDEAGVPSAAGSEAYADRVPGRDAEVVRRLRDSGGVIIGRTNLHELADGVTSENRWRGPVLHPLRPDHHPGGSSGGSAVAVAAGCVPLGLGTDTGGSVRIPASLCGVMGLKPTKGRIPTEGGIPLSTTLDHVGILATNVGDLAIAFGALAEPAAPGPRDPVEAQTGRPLRLGLLPGSAFGLEPDPEVGALLGEAVGRLEAVGHQVIQVVVQGLERGIALLSAIYPPEAAAWHRERLEACPERFGEEVLRDLRRGLRPGAEEKRSAALEEAARLGRHLGECFAAWGLDLLISPTTPHPARPLGSPNPHTYLTYTCPFNLAGLPALSLPMGLVSGLPAGLQLVGPLGADEALLAAARELPVWPDAAADWRPGRAGKARPTGSGQGFAPRPRGGRPRLSLQGRRPVRLGPRRPRKRGAS